MRNICKKVLLIPLVFLVISVITGCTRTAAEPQKEIFFEYFDTVCTVSSYAKDSEKEFNENCNEIKAILEKCHRLFDIYHEYSGMNNLYTLNNSNGREPINVDPLIIEFLCFAKDVCEMTNGKTNAAMGSVLSLWHNARISDTPVPPSQNSLSEASKHTGFDKIEIDKTNNTVRFFDSQCLLDAGALGKGFAAEKAAQFLRNKGVTSYVLDIGGNICAVGTKNGKDPWVIGLKNPEDPTQLALKIQISNASCVTSGSYERFFEYNGKTYSHIIDPDTNYPPEYFLSVSVICDDSALADALSTALFCMPYEQGRLLVDSLEKVECVWIFKDKSIKYTDNVKIC